MKQVVITKKLLNERYSKEFLDEVAFIEDNLANMPIYAKHNMIFHNCLASGIVVTVEKLQNALRDYQNYRYAQYMKQKGKCCICGYDYEEFGHNPEPLKNNGRCCYWCNMNIVLPLRVRLTYIKK